MAKIKYGIWFHGNNQESEGICYSGREPYIVYEKPLAESYLEIMKDNFCGNGEFSICTIVIDKV